MKKIILTVIGLSILFGVDVYAAGGLSAVTTKVTDIRKDVLTLMKVLAGFGLLFIIGSYVMSTDENKRFPWKWVIGALAIGAFASILTMFGL